MKVEQSLTTKKQWIIDSRDSEVEFGFIVCQVVRQISEPVAFDVRIRPSLIPVEFGEEGCPLSISLRENLMRPSKAR